MEPAVFRQSKAYLTSAVIFWGICSLFVVGIPFLIGALLAYSRHKITLGDRTVTLSRGVMVATVTDVPYSKINSVGVSRGLTGMVFNSGTVTISTGNDIAGIVFKNIERPEELKLMLQARMS
jgi:uncharacterized membrane protein YdbT with pleckstrin-like domain